MADILASVSIVLGAEVSGFQRAMAQARRDLSGLVKFAEGMKDVGQSLTQYVTLPLAALGAASVAASGKVESLKKGLEAISLQELGKQGVTGVGAVQQAAQQAGERLLLLQQIAKQPGLTFEGAVQGDIRLRAVGISAEQSAKSIRAFANAIATTGGGGAELASVTVQLAQLSAKGKVLAQDLRPIIEAAPAVASALQTLYGTVDSETISASLAKQGKSSKDFIAILTDELAKLPQVSGGLKNAFENLADNALLALGKIGDGISKSLNVPGLVEGLNAALTSIADGFTSLSPATQTAIVGLAGLAAATGPVLVALGALGVALPAIRAGILEVRAATVLLQNNMATLRAGLAAVLSPTGAIIAALATLAAVIYAASTEGERLLESYQQQVQSTKELTGNLTPLLARYDQLTANTSRNATEQEELRSVMEKLAQAVPGVTTKLDENGRAAEINTAKVRALVAAQQELLRAKAVKALPDQQKELDQAEAYNRVLQKRLQYFNETGKFQQNIGLGLTRDYVPDQQVLDNFRLYLAQSNVDLAKQRQLVEELSGSAGVLTSTLREQTAAYIEDGLALKLLGGAGEQATGLLTQLHEQLKQLKQEQQDAPTEKLALAYNPLIKNLSDYISRLEGADKAGKKSADAIAKLRQELARLTALDNLLGNTPNQLEVLERRSDTLEKGLKTLVDAGVSTSSKAFQGFAADLVRTSQAADKLIASAGQLGGKTVAVKSLIPTTIGDTLPQDVARLLGDYAKKPVVLPLKVLVKVQEVGFTSNPAQALNDALVQFGRGMQQVNATTNAFGSNIAAAFAGFDGAAAKVNLARAAMQDLLAQGFKPTSAEVQSFVKDIRKYTIEAQNTQILTQGMASAFSQLGASIGESLVNGGNVLEAAGQALLKSLAQIGAQYGQFLIAMGIADVAFGITAAKGAAEIAAGTALIAASSALGAIASGGTSTGGASSSVSSPAITNYGQNSNQTTVKVLAEFRLRGQDLVALGQQKEFRSRVAG